MPWIVGLVAVSGAAFYFADDTMDSTARVVKWSAVAGGVYLAGRYMKAW